MKCVNAQEEISQYYDGQLGKKKWKELKGHLAGCDNCLELFQKMGAMDNKVKTLQYPFKPSFVKREKKAIPVFRVLVAGSSIFGVLIATIIGINVMLPKSMIPDITSYNSPSSNDTKDLLGSSKSSGDRVESYGGDSGSINAESKNKIENSLNDTKGLQIVQSISLTLKVKNIIALSKKITKLVETSGGYISSSNLATPEEQKQGSESTIVTKIPVEKLGEAKAEIGKLGVVIAEKVDTEDVSLTLVDLEARLRNYKKQEARYLVLIDKATKISDLQSLESNLANIRQSIEEAQGELKYQKSRVAMATLTINLVKKIKPITKDNCFVKMFSSALQVFAGVSASIIYILFGLLPFALIGLLGYGVYRFVRH